MKEKMRFEEFKVAVLNGIRDWLPEQFTTAEIGLQVVTKNNDIKLTGLTIRSVDSNIAPTIYLEGFYEKYQEGVEMPEILKRIAEIRIEHEVEGDFDASQITDFSKCRNRIFPKIVSAEWNAELLENCPYVLIEDLAVTFYIDLGTYENGSMSVSVKNNLMHEWGVTADELYEIAVQNLSDADMGTFISMNELLSGMMLPDIMKEYDCDREAAEQILQMMMPPESTMYVLTNKDMRHGACMVLDRKMMQKVIATVGNDFYIIPSSVHECIVLPACENTNPSYLHEMVHEVNFSQVSVQDRLSENVYRYTLSGGLEVA